MRGGTRWFGWKNNTYRDPAVGDDETHSKVGCWSVELEGSMSKENGSASEVEDPGVVKETGRVVKALVPLAPACMNE